MRSAPAIHRKMPIFAASNDNKGLRTARELVHFTMKVRFSKKYGKWQVFENRKYYGNVILEEFANKADAEKFVMARKTISCVDGVKRFFSSVIKAVGCSFHPDDPFSSYVDTDGNRIFSDCAEYDKRMGECFDVCENCGEDVYRLCAEILSSEGYMR